MYTRHSCIKYSGFIYFCWFHFSWIKENLNFRKYLISWFCQGLHKACRKFLVLGIFILWFTCTPEIHQKMVIQSIIMNKQYIITDTLYMLGNFSKSVHKNVAICLQRHKQRKFNQWHNVICIWCTNNEITNTALESEKGIRNRCLVKVSQSGIGSRHN